MNFKGKAKPLDEIDIPRMAAAINVREDYVRAVDETESRGNGFDKLGRPKMLFEPHLFYAALHGQERADAVAAGLAYPKWKKAYPADSYPRLEAAMKINVNAALESASWGRYQCLGMHYRMLGYNSPEDMVQAFMADEESHLEGFITFIISSGVDDDLREGRFNVFFRVYNGSAYAQNGYPEAFARNLKKWVKVADLPVADPDRMQTSAATVKTVQKRLIELGYREIGMPDGDMGSRTRGAILGFRLDHGLPLVPIIDQALLAELMQASVRPIGAARAEATVADLREGGSATVKVADKTSGAAVALGGASVADALLQQVSGLKSGIGTAQGVLDSVSPLKDALISVGPWAIGAIAVYIGYQQYLIRQDRLANHRSGKTSTIGD